MMTSDYFEYNCGFLDSTLQYLDAAAVDDRLFLEGLYHSWFRWNGFLSKSDVIGDWKSRFGKQSLFLARVDSPMDLALGGLLEELGVELSIVTAIPDCEEFRNWVLTHSGKWMITDPVYACFAWLSHQELKKGREVLWAFPQFEVKDMNWQFTDASGSEEVITQEQPHWVINDFFTTLTPYLIKKEYAHFHWGLALQLLPAFLLESGFFEHPEKFRLEKQKVLHEHHMAQWLDPSGKFAGRTSVFDQTASPIGLERPRGRSYNLISNAIKNRD